MDLLKSLIYDLEICKWQCFTFSSVDEQLHLFLFLPASHVYGLSQCHAISNCNLLYKRRHSGNLLRSHVLVNNLLRTSVNCVYTQFHYLIENDGVSLTALCAHILIRTDFVVSYSL